MISINLMTAAMHRLLAGRRWRENNLTRSRELSRAYRHANIEKERQRSRDKMRLWRKNNPEKDKDRNRAWRELHLESERARVRKVAQAWRKKNPKYDSEYAKSHPEKCREKSRKRRAIKAGAGGGFTTQEFKALGTRCLCCGRSEKELSAIGLRLVPDHVIALSRGGSNDISNIQPLCHGLGGCNNRKFVSHIDYRGRLCEEKSYVLPAERAASEPHLPADA